MIDRCPDRTERVSHFRRPVEVVRKGAGTATGPNLFVFGIVISRNLVRFYLPFKSEYPSISVCLAAERGRKEPDGCSKSE